MKALLLVLFFLVSCSTHKYYSSPEVAKELEKNGEQLRTISSYIEQDYSSKEAFVSFYSRQREDKSEFVLQDLKGRLEDLKNRKEAILAQTSYIKSINDDLLNKVTSTDKVEQKDPLFKQIESFSEVSKRDAKSLFTEVHDYRKNSEDFVKFTIFTRNTILKSERQ